MATLNHAQRLLAGSHRIDQMRKEIEELVRLLSRELSFWQLQKPVYDGGSILLVEDLDIRWELFEIRKGVLAIHCLVNATETFKITCTEIWEPKQKTNYVVFFSRDTTLIKAAHSSLPRFLEGMEKEFPVLQGYLQPFFDAADE